MHFEQSHGALGETSDNYVDTNIFLYQLGAVLVKKKDLFAF